MARELLLIRHGIAVERGSTATDEERALTSEGRARTRRVLERLERLGLACGPLVSSPLVRARQTAELALERKLGKSLSFSDLLPAVIKTFFFGFAVGIVGCYKGFHSSKGTQGVGISANSAVVLSSVLIFIIDLLAVQITEMLGLN